MYDTPPVICRQLVSEETGRPERPSASHTSRDVMTPLAKSAAFAPVTRPAAATEPISRLLIFIIDLQSQSFLYRRTGGLSKRDHTSGQCVAAAFATDKRSHAWIRSNYSSDEALRRNHTKDEIPGRQYG